MVTNLCFNEILAREEMKDMEAAEKRRADFKTKGSTVVEQILGDSQYICGLDYVEFATADASLGWLLLLCGK